METTPSCPSCGKSLASDAPQGLCQECLLKAGFPTGADTDGKSLRFVPPAIEELAEKFPQLEILEFIGQGGMGAVYKARQKQLNRLVALKILPPGIGEDPAFAERFTREAQALAQLNHPGIVTLYEFGQADGLFYFQMEFVDGVNLRQLLRTGRVSAREALAIVPQICDALQFAHDQGLVHRDIKPENILLDRRGRVKVADFGLAKLVGSGSEPMLAGAASGSPELTEAGKIMGTPSYMAPEQVGHPADVDHRADIYALGVVFYQMLTGELPDKKIEPPSKKVQVDVRLDEIVLRAMEKNPDRRYQHVSEVGADVETISYSAPNAKPGISIKKPILLFVLGVGGVCALFVAALLMLSHGKSAHTLKVRMLVDATDVIKVSGDRLWIEHESGGLSSKAVFINGQAWTPTWTTTNSNRSKAVSSEFVGLKPPFRAHSAQGIQMTNTVGRGVVSFEQFPSADNDETLAVRVDDEEPPGADWYEIIISWDERTRSPASAKATPKTGAESDSQPAVSAAEKWLAIIDAGDYSRAWKESSMIYQGVIDERRFTNEMNTFRKPLGDLISRRWASAKALTTMPGAPDGQYVLMQFETSFANKKSAIETVTFMQENGQWKNTGYYIK